MENSKIEWTDHTCNLWHGCTEVHAGCDNCYAKALNHRYHKSDANWGNDAPRRMLKNPWSQFKRLQTHAAAAGEMHKVFVGSMMDIGEKSMPMVNYKGEAIPDSVGKTGYLRSWYYNEIVPSTPNLIHLCLTKRPGLVPKQVPLKWLTEGPPVNIMWGASIVDQPTANTLMPQLLQIKGKRFLSLEPLLGPVALDKLYGEQEWPLQGIDWVIVGGESGPGRRPIDLEWARDIRDRCAMMGVPFFFKQIDKVNKDIPADLQIQEFPAYLFTNEIASKQVQKIYNNLYEQ